jgi:hypothetical protein
MEVAVYYFPQYHPDPRNDAWHGKDWTEWELVKHATSRFQGHYQPLTPEWGYFDESDPAWTAREIDLAADHGVTTFLYDWYWWEDGPFLQTALENGFLAASNRNRMKFAIMWANHNWANIHPAPYGRNWENLALGKVSRRTFDELTDHVVDYYFSQPNLLKIDGEPFFSIYELQTFIEGLGGMNETKRALEEFRRKTIRAGFPGLHLNAVAWQADPAIALDLGVASIHSYCWAHHVNMGNYGFPLSDYAKNAVRAIQVWDELAAKFPMPYCPNVSMGWDSSPRTVQSDRFENRGYPFTPIYSGNTPAAFEEALKSARAWLSRPETSLKMLTINAWNEWTEGSFLLPEKRYGDGYLRAIRNVFSAQENATG